jgi:hypothetical protein
MAIKVTQRTGVPGKSSFFEVKRLKLSAFHIIGIFDGRFIQSLQATLIG